MKPRQLWGNYKGTDYFGNKYYEIPASETRRRGSRYFVPPDKENFEQERPAEWESWLRGRRKDPPTEEELARNLAIMQMKKENAKLIDAKGGTPTPLPKGMETFPKRPEYESVPGKRED